MANWSGGNLHPISQLDIEADYTKGQHLGGNYFSCTMSAGTSCTATLTSATWHACIAQVQSTTATSVGVFDLREQPSPSLRVRAILQSGGF